MTDHFGMGRCLTIGAVLQLLGYCVVIAPPPFPVFPPTFVFIGLGVAWQGTVGIRHSFVIDIN